MSGEERRKEIIRLLSSGDKPLAGGKLAGILNVSRQVVVQDIALLRAEGYDIFSTNRGYIIQSLSRASRVVYVHHSDDRIQEELDLIVDNGGYVQDVFVHHTVYGELKADLSIGSRKKVRDFMEELNTGKSSPLNTITSGYHYHTILAESEEVLDIIVNELNTNGFLVVETDKMEGDM